jgi:Leucine-rich repeat (LRR) protein
MGVFAADSSPARSRTLRAAGAAFLLCVPLALGSSRPLLADEQIITAPRGSLTVRPIDQRVQVVEWIGPGSTQLAWPSIDQHGYTILSLRVVPTGLAQVGLVAALTPTWGLNLCGVALSDDDMSFLIKRCRNLGILRLRHPSALAPDEIGDLTDDERGALAVRTLSGVGLAKLERLKRLMLLEITGYELPPTRLQFLSELKQLRWLVLCDMKITDEDLRSLSGLPNLSRLDLSGTSVTGSGLRYLTNCPSLNCLTLNRTRVTDDLAKTLKDNPLPQLQQLHVHGCRLTPNGLSALRSALPLFATVIESDYSMLSSASVTPPAPRDAQAIREYRAACDLLWGFDVAGFQTTGRTVTGVRIYPEGWAPAGDWVLRRMSTFKGLKHLWLGGCKLSADGLEQLQEHDQLEWLDLSSSTVDDAGIERIAGLSRLRGINLNKTKLTDAAVESLSHLRNLERLYLDNTQVTDRGLRAIRFQLSLKILDLRNCPITDEGAQQLSANTTLEYVRLDNTRLTDRGLRALANLPRLKGLSCTNCKITDEGAEKLLRAENLAYCQLEGTSVSKSLRMQLADHVSGVQASLRTELGSTSSGTPSELDLWNLDDAASSTRTERRY